MSESNQRSKTLIRELYELSESGALDQIDSKVVDSACDFIQNFINPVVTYKQAAKISGKSISSIYNKVSRSGIMGMGKVKELLAETKENLEMLCEMVEEMEGDDYGERGGQYGQRGGYVNRGGDGGSSVGMRRGYRIYQDDDEFGERRRRDSRGRYM